jgi:hypothetical protein
LGIYAAFYTGNALAGVELSFAWGVETVGEFESEPFEGDVRNNLISALATLHAFAGLHPGNYSIGVRGLHFHKEDPVTTHRSCPGRNRVKAELVTAVETEMLARNGGGHAHISNQIQTARTARLATSGILTDDAWLQERLNTFGAGLELNGELDPPTKAAVLKFQETHGLKADGIPGPLTRLALSRAASGPHEVKAMSCFNSLPTHTRLRRNIQYKRPFVRQVRRPLVSTKWPLK